MRDGGWCVQGKKKRENKKKKAKGEELEQIPYKKVERVEGEPEIIRSGPGADDPENVERRWEAADKERKEHAKEDAARRKEGVGKWEEWDSISQAERDLIEAVEDEDPEGVEAAIEAGANINRHYQISGQMTSTLMYSSLMGFADVAEVLLKHDADMNIDMQGTGFTPIHGSAFQGHPDVIKLLLAAGADANHRHQDGFQPMHRACWGNTPKHTEAVLVFLEHGVDVLTTAMDPDYPGSDTFEETGGLMTPLNMSGTNPMTIGLLEEWEKYGHAPMRPMGNWGEDAFLRGQHASTNDATVRKDEL